MKKSTLEVSTFTEGGSLWLYLDSRLILKDSDQGSIELGPEIEHIVFWYVEGPPGSTYSISISSPREAEYQLTKSLRASGKDQGSFLIALQGVTQMTEINPIYYEKQTPV